MNEENKILDDDLLAGELSEIEKELKDISDLYTEVKDHLDNIKGNPFKGSLTFVEKQTTNLINIKNAKLNLIREKINIKKSLTDFKFKEANLKADSGVDSYNYKELLTNIVSELKNTNDNDIITNNSNVDEELDKISNDIDISSIVEDKTKDIEKPENTSANDELTIAVDSNENFYKVNNKLEIVEELGHIEHIKESIEFHDGEYRIGESGTLYMYVELEN